MLCQSDGIITGGGEPGLQLGALWEKTSYDSQPGFILGFYPFNKILEQEYVSKTLTPILDKERFFKSLK